MSNTPITRAARANWGSDDSQTPILHVDMDAFFAEVELLDNPALRGQPVVVGGIGLRGVVCSATYQARAYGVRAGMPIGRAKSLCPHAHFLPTRHGVYGKVSAEVMKVLSSFTPVVEQVSVDEAYLDVSGSRLRLGNPTQIATQIRQRIRSELSLPASIGIGANKLVAKIGSSQAKPDGMLLVPANRTQDFLDVLPVAVLPGVGGKTAKILGERGIDTVAQLRMLPLAKLRRLLGDSAAFRLSQLALGKDRRPVEVSREEKSIGTETTFSENIESLSVLLEVALDQCHQNAARLRRKGLQAATISVKLRDKNFQTITRSRTLSEPTDVAAQMYQVVADTIRSQRIPAGGYRLQGVRAENLRSVSQGVQGRLDEDPRRRQAEVAMDKVRGKFGNDAVKPATLLKPPPSPSSQP